MVINGERESRVSQSVSQAVIVAYVLTVSFQYCYYYYHTYIVHFDVCGWILFHFFNHSSFFLSLSAVFPHMKLDRSLSLSMPDRKLYSFYFHSQLYVFQFIIFILLLIPIIEGSCCMLHTWAHGKIGMKWEPSSQEAHTEQWHHVASGSNRTAVALIKTINIEFFPSYSSLFLFIFFSFSLAIVVVGVWNFATVIRNMKWSHVAGWIDAVLCLKPNEKKLRHRSICKQTENTEKIAKI